MAQKSRRTNRFRPDGLDGRRTVRSRPTSDSSTTTSRGLFLPIPLRLLVAATRAPAVRRTLSGIRVDRPRVWANLACRKRFIGDKLTEAIDEIDAVVILGAGLDTRAYRLTTTGPQSGLRGGPAAQHRPQEPPVHGCWATSPCRFGWWRGLRARRPAHRAGRARLPHRLPGSSSSGKASPNTSPRMPCARRWKDCARRRRASRCSFTYVRRDFIDGSNSTRHPLRCTARCVSGSSCGTSGYSPKWCQGSFEYGGG